MNTITVIIYLSGAILIILLSKLLYAWYAEIDKRNRYLEAQIKLLARLNILQGGESDKIDLILSDSKIPLNVKGENEMSDSKIAVGIGIALSFIILLYALLNQ